MASESEVEDRPRKRKRKKRRKRPAEGSGDPDPPPEDSSEGRTLSERESEAESDAVDVGPKRSLKELMRDLQDKSHRTRDGAAKALGAMGPGAKKAVLRLAKVLGNDDNERVRYRAARALGKIGPDAAAAAPALVKALKDGKKDRTRDPKTVPGASARALKKIGSAGLPHLFAALADPRRRDPVVRVLRSVPLTGDESELAEGFTDLLKGKNRRASMAAIEAIEQHEEDAIPLLLIAMGDPDAKVSKGALRAIKAIGKDGVAALVEALESDTWHVRANAATALGSVAKHVSQRAVSRHCDVLMDALTDDSCQVRVKVVEALGSLTDYGQKVLPGLIEALGDDDSMVSLQAVLGILNLTVDRQDLCSRMCKILARNRSVYTRVGAATVLMHMGAEAKDAVDQLKRSLEDEAEEVREYAHLALQSIRTPSMRIEVVRTASMRLKVVEDEARATWDEVSQYARPRLGSGEGEIPAVAGKKKKKKKKKKPGMRRKRRVGRRR